MFSKTWAIQAALAALVLLLPCPADAQSKKKKTPTPAPTPLGPLVLQKGTVTAEFLPNAAWGKAEPLPLKESDAENRSAYVPLLDEKMQYSGYGFFKPVPAVPEMQANALTVALAIVPAKLTDDEGATGPEEDRDPYALTAKEKAAAYARLEKIYQDRAIDTADYFTPEMESPPNLVGGWWGSPGAVLDILDIRYVETPDGGLRGVAFFFTEGQDVNFRVSYRIILADPAQRAVFLLQAPLDGFDALKKYQKTVESATDGDLASKAYQQGEAFLRNRESWSGTPMGKLVAQMDEAANSLVVERP